MPTQKNQQAIDQKSVEIIQLTDPHLFENLQGKLLGVETEKTLMGVLAHIKTHPSEPDLLLLSGDLAQSGHAQVYARLESLFQDIAPEIRAIPGNHDDPALMQSILPQSWCEPVTDIGTWRIVCLDSSIRRSNAGTLHEDQLQLIEQSCQQAPDRHVLLAVHHNPIPMGSTWLDPMMIDNADQLMTLVGRFANIKAITWGHVHQAFDSVYAFGARRAPVRLLSTPATSIQFAVNSANFALDDVAPGYRQLSLKEDGNIETKVIRVPIEGITPDWKSGGY